MWRRGAVTANFGSSSRHASHWLTNIHLPLYRPLTTSPSRRLAPPPPPHAAPGLLRGVQPTASEGADKQERVTETIEGGVEGGLTSAAPSATVTAAAASVRPSSSQPSTPTSSSIPSSRPSPRSSRPSPPSPRPSPLSSHALTQFWRLSNRFLLEGQVGHRALREDDDHPHETGSSGGEGGRSVEHSPVGSHRRRAAHVLEEVAPYASDPPPSRLEARWRAHTLAALQAPLSPQQPLDQLLASLEPPKKIKGKGNKKWEKSPPAQLTLPVQFAKDLQRPNERELALMEKLYEQVVREELPPLESDPSAASSSSPSPSPGGGLNRVSFIALTHALLRLVVANPPDYHQRQVPLPERKVWRYESLKESKAFQQPAQYPIDLLTSYWRHLSNPATPFHRPREVHLWKLHAAIHTLVAIPSRPGPDRKQLIEALLEAMKSERWKTRHDTEASQPQQLSLYDYAIKNEVFFRALMFACLHTDMQYAATFLPHVPSLTLPHPMSSSALHAPTPLTRAAQYVSRAPHRTLVTSPITRSQQVYLFQSFMATCCARMRVQRSRLFPQQAATPSSTEPTSPAALEAFHSMQLSKQQRADFSRSTLLELFPDVAGEIRKPLFAEGEVEPDEEEVEFAAIAELLTPAQKSGESTTAVCSPPLPSFSLPPPSTLLDLLVQSFTLMMQSGLPPSIDTYNLLIYGLTHTPTRPEQVQEGESTESTSSLSALPTASSIHTLLLDCLTTIERERLCYYNLTTFNLLLHFCSQHRGDGSQPEADRLKEELLEFTLPRLSDHLAWLQRRQRRREEREQSRL